MTKRICSSYRESVFLNALIECYLRLWILPCFRFLRQYTQNSEYVFMVSSLNRLDRILQCLTIYLGEFVVTMHGLNGHSFF